MKDFSFTIDSSKLSRGLRPSRRMPRNSLYLIECEGAVGRDGVLQVLDEITRIDTTLYTLDYTNIRPIVNSFEIGDVVRGFTSGAYGTVVLVEKDGDDGKLYLSNVSGTFVDGEILYLAYGDELTTGGDCSTDSFVADAGWTHDGVNGEYDCYGIDEADLYQDVLTDGYYCKTVYAVINYDSGGLIPYAGDQAGTEVTANGTYTEHIICDTTGYASLKSNNFIGSVSYISWKQITTGATVDGTASLAASFPYPQIFVFTNLIIVCTSTTIFELVSDTLVHKLTVAAGSTWTALDFYDYVYLSNGTVAVIRDALKKTYATTTDLPTAMAACNFNGQVILGGADAGYEI